MAPRSVLHFHARGHDHPLCGQAVEPTLDVAAEFRLLEAETPAQCEICTAILIAWRAAGGPEDRIGFARKWLDDHELIWDPDDLPADALRSDSERDQDVIKLMQRGLMWVIRRKRDGRIFPALTSAGREAAIQLKRRRP